MKQRIIKSLTVILFGLLLSVKVVSAENWVPEWAQTQSYVDVYDITNDINSVALASGYSTEDEKFLKDGKCFLTIDAGRDKGNNEQWGEQYLYNYTYSNESIFLPIQVYCTQGIEYANRIYQNEGYSEIGEELGDTIMIIYQNSSISQGGKCKNEDSFLTYIKEYMNNGYNKSDLYTGEDKGFWVAVDENTIYIKIDNIYTTESCLHKDYKKIKYQFHNRYDTNYIDFFKNNNIGPYVALPPVTPDNPNTPTTPNRPNTGTNTNRPSGFVQCSDIDVDKIKACGCIPAGVADITSKIYFILRIVGPVLLLILGGFDMAKAVASQDESSITKAKKKLVNKFIAAAAIFFVLTIMEFVVGIFAKNAEGILKCIYILLDGYVI